MTSNLYQLSENCKCSVAFSKMFAHEIYDNLEIFQTCPFDEFYNRNLRFITDADRWEYIVVDSRGHTKASMVFCEDEDVHVGRCMLIMCAFSTGGYSLSGGYREAIKKAKELGLKWLVYNRQITPVKHMTFYKELK